MAERNNTIIDQRMKITNKQTNREDMFDPETPANQKILSTLNPESKKMYERALKQNSKDFKKGGGRGDGTAELTELLTGGRNKERIKNELIDSFLDMSKKVRSKAKGGSVRAFNNGGAVMSGRGPKFKGIK